MRFSVIIRILLVIAFVQLTELGYAQKIFQSELAADAQIKVYPVDEPDDADLWVCFVWDEAEITRTGLWMDMRFMHEADIVIFFVDFENEADLKIWLVDTPEESKWLTENRKKLLVIKKTPK